MDIIENKDMAMPSRQPNGIVGNSEYANKANNKAMT